MKKVLQDDHIWKYFKKVECHRTFLLAMSMYKFKKYGEKSLQMSTSKDKAQVAKI